MELQKETLRNLYYFAKMFGTYRNNSYLCSVKSLLLAIRVNFPRGASLYRHYPFKKSSLWMAFYFSYFFRISKCKDTTFRANKQTIIDNYFA